MKKSAAVLFLLACVVLLPAHVFAQITVSPATIPPYEGPANGSTMYFPIRIDHPTPVAWTSSATTQNGGNWLGVAPSGGTTPTDADIVINTNLPAGTYRGTVFISVALPGGMTVSRDVTIILSGSGAGGTPTANPPSITITAGTNAPSGFSIEVGEQTTPAGGGSVLALAAGEAGAARNGWRDAQGVTASIVALNFTVSVNFLSGSNWLAVSPTSGSTPATLRATLNYSAIPAAGVYQAAIVIRDTASGRSVNVPVTVTVPGSQGRLIVSQNAVQFTNSSSAPTSAAPQTLQIMSGGPGSLNWTLTGGMPGWLRASATSGSAGNSGPAASSVTLRSDSTGLASGVYQALLTFRAAGVPDEVVTVTLLVVPATSPAAPSVQPAGMVFVNFVGAGSFPPPQNLLIGNAGGGTFSFQLVPSTTSGGNWLSVTPTGGDSASEPVTAQVRVNAIGLPAGVYRGKLAISFTTGIPAQEVEVVFVNTNAAPSGGVAPATAGRAVAAACPGNGIEIVGTSIGNGAVLPVSFPKVLLALAVDNCGSAVPDASVVASVDGTSTAMQAVGNGFYSGTWVPQTQRSGIPLVITASHAALTTPVRRTYTVSTAAAAGGAQLPVLPAGAVVEGAGFTPGRPLAPGGIISLFGQRLANATGSSSSVPLARDIGGVSVRIGDQNAPLYFVSPGQINAQVPFELAPGSTVPIVVNSGGRLTAPVPYTIAAAQPAIFRVGSDTAVLDSQFRLINPQNPAVIGGTIQIYATGLGLTDVNVQTGNSWPGLSNVRVPVSVTIGGLPAQVAFQGLAPNFVGLYQVNAVVPSGVTPGSAVPLVITQNGVPSNPDSPVTIPVRAP